MNTLSQTQLSRSALAPQLRAVLIDMDGTMASAGFRKETLLPFARSHLTAFVAANEAALADVLEQLRALAANRELPTERLSALVLRWMDAGRRVPALEALLSLVWLSGYNSGELHALAHVYDDAVRALRQWHGAGIKLFLSCAGPGQTAQRLISHTQHGDLSPLFAGFFGAEMGSGPGGEQL